MTTDPVSTTSTETTEEQLDQTLGQTADDMLGTVIDKLADAETPGYWAEFTREEAEMAGAFTENALSEEAAYDASFDNPTVLTDDDDER